MTTTDAKIDFLGEMIGLDDLINRVEAMARIETSISDPWFIGECVYSCGNLPHRRWDPPRASNASGDWRSPSSSA